MRITLTSLLCAIALSSVGCGSKETEIISISGTVTWNGQPLESGTISFLEAGKSNEATEIVDGEFELETLPGDKRVGIIATKIVTSSGASERDAGYTYQYLPHEFNDQSELTATITDGKEPLNFDLKGVEIAPPDESKLSTRPRSPDSGRTPEKRRPN